MSCQTISVQIPGSATLLSNVTAAQGPPGIQGPPGTGGIILSVTGSSLITGIVNFTGNNNLQVILSGNNTIVFSGGAGGGGGESNTSSNLGSGIGLFANKVGVDLRFYNITGGTGISLSRIDNDIFVNSSLNTGQFSSSGNLFSTGSNLSNQIIGLSGVLNSNFATITNLTNTGINLQNQLNIINARSYVTGISVNSSITPLTGLMGISGAGNVSVSQSGQTLYFSGNTGMFSNFLGVSLTGQFGASGNLTNTGITLHGEIAGLSGTIDYVRSYITGISVNGAAGGLTGRVGISGAGNIIISQSGQTLYISGNTGDYSTFVSKTESGQFGASGNLYNTGNILHNEIIGISGAFNNSGQILINYINSVSGLSVNQLTGVSVTGSSPNVIGVANLSGLGGLSVILSGNNTILFSGGAATASVFNGFTVTGISIAGASSITGLVNFSGIGGINVIQNNQTVLISGIQGSVVPFVLGSGKLVSGSDLSQFVRFQQNFNTAPIILANLSNNLGEAIFGYQISGASNSGFYFNLSETLSSNNYLFNYLAVSGSGFYNIGGTTGPAGTSAPFEKSILIENPGNSENISFFFTKGGCTVTQITSILTTGAGSITPALTWSLKYATGRTDDGNEVINQGITVTGTSFPIYNTIFDNPIIPTGVFVYIQTSGNISGTINSLSATINLV